MYHHHPKTICPVPLRLLAAVCASLSWLPPVAAQSAPPTQPALTTPAPPNAGQLLEQVRPAPPPPSATRPVLPPVQRAALPDDATPVRVTGFEFVGNTVFSKAQLQSLMEASLAAGGQPANSTTNLTTPFGALRRAADSITQAYLAQGYLLARAVIARQDLASSTVLRIQVLEGTLGNLQISPPQAQTDLQTIASATFAAQGLQPGVALQQAPLERGVLLLSDRFGSPAIVSLKAGSSLGSTDVVVQTNAQTSNAEAKAWRAQLVLDNFGNRYTGLWRAGADATWLSPTTLGDSINLRTQLSTGLQFAALAYQRPVGYDGWRLGVNASALSYQLCCQFATLGAAGSAQTAGLTARYPLLLAASRNLFLDAAINQRSSVDSTVAGITADKTVRSAQLGLSFNHAGAWPSAAVPNGWLQNGQLQLTAGNVDLSRTPGNATQDALTAQTAGSFTKLRLDYSAVAPLSASTQVSARFASQSASKNLDSGERFSLGGANTLRAYPAGEAGGDSGWLLNLEARYVFSSWSRIYPLGYSPKTPSKSTKNDDLEPQNTPNTDGSGGSGNWFVSGFIDTGRITQRRNLWTGALANGTAGSQPNRYSLNGLGVSLGYSAPTWQATATLASAVGSNSGADALGNNSDGRNRRNRLLFQISKSL